MSSTIPMTVPIETAEHNLKQMLEQLQPGETMTLVNSEGAPLAILILLKPAPSKAKTASEWWARWDTLVQKVSQAWQGDKSALEILTEMRR